MSEVRTIVCKVSKGMFSDEVVVLLRLKIGDYSFFVPRAEVENGPNEVCRLKVRVMRQDHQSWAIVPNEDRTAIPVREEDLVEA